MLDIRKVLGDLLDRAVEEYGDEELAHHIQVAADTATGIDVGLDIGVEVDVGELLKAVKGLVERETPMNANTSYHLAQAQVRASQIKPKVKASDAAKRAAEEHGLDLAGVTGTGKDGTVTKQDVASLVEEMA